MPKYKITVTEDILGGRSSIQMRIPDGPVRVLTADEPKVELNLTPEQAKSVEQAGYEVSPSPLAEKIKAAKERQSEAAKPAPKAASKPATESKSSAPSPATTSNTDTPKTKES